MGDCGVDVGLGAYGDWWEGGFVGGVDAVAGLSSGREFIVDDVVVFLCVEWNVRKS